MLKFQVLPECPVLPKLLPEPCQNVNSSKGSITNPVNPVWRQAALSIVSKHHNLLTCGGSHERLSHHDTTQSTHEETTPIVKVLAGFSLLNTLSTWHGEWKYESLPLFSYCKSLLWECMFTGTDPLGARWLSNISINYDPMSVVSECFGPLQNKCRAILENAASICSPFQNMEFR